MFLFLFVVLLGFVDVFVVFIFIVVLVVTFVVIVIDPRSLPLKLCQNRVSNS